MADTYLNYMGKLIKLKDNGDGTYSVATKSPTVETLIGEKSDAAATVGDATPFSAIALLKGIFTKLLGTLAVQILGSTVAEAKVVNVTLAGTRQQLDDKACREVTIIAKRGNTGYIYVGKSNVSSTVYGVELSELDSVTLEVSNTNEIYIDASVSGEGISYVAI